MSQQDDFCRSTVKEEICHMVNLKIAAAFTALALALVPSAAYSATATATEIAPATPLPDVPRNQTLVLGWSITSPINTSHGSPRAWSTPARTSPRLRSS